MRTRLKTAVDSFTRIVRNELSGWKTWEIVWALFCCATICGLSVYWRDSALGIVAATTGTLYVVCAGKGKPSAFLFGAINAICYSLIAFGAKFYAEFALNALYYFPLQFYGLRAWSRNMNAETNEVRKRAASPQVCAVSTLIAAVGTLALGFALQKSGGRFPYLDALTTVVSLVAMVASIQRFAEQWILWTVVNVASLAKWAVSFANGGEDAAAVLMWGVFLINGFIMYYRWRKEINASQTPQKSASKTP